MLALGSVRDTRLAIVSEEVKKLREYNLLVTVLNMIKSESASAKAREIPPTLFGV